MPRPEGTGGLATAPAEGPRDRPHAATGWTAGPGDVRSAAPARIARAGGSAATTVADMREKDAAGGLASSFGPLELAILEIHWGRGSEMDVAESCAHLPGDPAYTTVKTVMERLVRKGRLSRRKHGRAYVYRATESREEVVERLAAQSARRLVDGFGALAVTGFVDSLKGDAEQMAHLRELLERAARDGGRDA